MKIDTLTTPNRLPAPAESREETMTAENTILRIESLCVSYRSREAKLGRIDELQQERKS